jgi:hypothetical protein
MGKPLTTGEFVTKAILIHANKYDYSKTCYVNSHTNIIIRCPEHGDFLQLPNNHLSKRGCPRCGNSIGHEKLKPQFSIFIKTSNIVHNKKYDYSKFIYENNRTHGIVICPTHGEFLQTPTDHLAGKECKKCCHEQRRTSKKEFIKRASTLHKNKYDYSAVTYGNNNQEKVIIKCPIHGKFLQSPNKHLSGRGCRKCGREKNLQNFISKKETEFLNHIKLEKQNRQKYVNGYHVDGYDPQTNTIYEFLGDYWHGNPSKFSSEKVNFHVNKTFGELYRITFQRLSILKNNKIVKYIWERDWDTFVQNPNTTLKIQTL